MKPFPFAALLLSALLIVPTAARAQVSMAIRLNNTRTLLYEPLRCTIEISNRGGSAVLLEEDEIGFRIERSPGRLIELTEEPPFVGGVVIPANGRVSHTLNLLSYYDLFSTGPHTLQAWAVLDGERMLSKPVFFDVIPGLELNRATATHPSSEERRLFRLFTISRDHHERLLVRVDDAQGRLCFGVLDLGDLIRVDPPAMLVDNRGRLSVLHLSQPGVYFHSLLEFDGTPVSQTAYYARTGQIRLLASPTAGVVVEGGTPVSETEAGDMPVRRIAPRK